MDSGNSDSFQSSNGGDNEEYNSHGGGDTISALVNQSTTRVSSRTYNRALHQSTNKPMFDDPIISNYRNMQNNMVLNNNLDMAWSKTPRPDPNCTESTSPLSSQKLFTLQSSNLPSSSSAPETMNTRLSAQLLLNPKEMVNTTTSRTSSSPLSDHHQKHGLLSLSSQNIKKRSRASRRAPTTILTTDTTNFRAMVQEFTGIPAPPFTSSSSHFPRNYTNLENIFGTPSSMRTNPFDHLSTPFSTKVQPIVSQTSSSSMFAASMVDSLRTNVDDSYQRLQSENLFTMQNPILASLLQSTPPNRPLSDNNPSIFESRTRHGSMQIQSSNMILDDFGGLGQGLVDKSGSLGALPGLVSADPAMWGGGAGGANGGGGDQVRSIGNNNDIIANGKRLKGMIEDGAVGATNEGMMETWIRSSTE